MTIKNNFNEFVKNNSANLSHKLYKIMINEANRRNKDYKKHHFYKLNGAFYIHTLLYHYLHFNFSITYN